VIIDIQFHDEGPIQLQRVSMITVALRQGSVDHEMLIQFYDGPSKEYNLHVIRSYKVFND